MSERDPTGYLIGAKAIAAWYDRSEGWFYDHVDEIPAFRDKVSRKWCAHVEDLEAQRDKARKERAAELGLARKEMAKLYEVRS